VAELFEARSPKDAGLLGEITGTVSFGKEHQGQAAPGDHRSGGRLARVPIPKDKHVMAHDGQS